MYPQRNGTSDSASERSVTSEPKGERSVLIVGAGALGCAAAAVLAPRVPRVTLIDPDRVEHSNLPAQLLYTDGDVGRRKAEAAAERLGTSGARVDAIVGRFDLSNADELVTTHDFVVDACDHPPTKLAINDTALRVQRPFCYGGVSRTGGLVLAVAPRSSACLACAFGPPPASTSNADAESTDAPGRAPAAASDVAGCHETGVLAPVAAVIGTLQALEALGALGLGGAWHPGRLAIYELRGRRWRFMEMPRDARCAACAGKPLGAHARRAQSCRF